MTKRQTRLKNNCSCLGCETTVRRMKKKMKKKSNMEKLTSWSCVTNNRATKNRSKKKKSIFQWAKRMLKYLLKPGTKRKIPSLRCRRTMRIKKATLEKATPYLPDDLLFFGVLARLPATSLLRFRSVNKTWNTQTHEPKFITSHSNYALNRPSLLGSFSLTTWGKERPFQIQFHFVEHSVPNRSFEWLNFPQRMDRIGHCNGLICLESRSGFGVLNPCTREVLFYFFPEPITNYSPLGVTCGFGFDPLNNEYKYVRIHAVNVSWTCFTYTLGTNSWKNFTLPNNVVDYFHAFVSEFYSPMALYSNGALYWCTGGNKVVSFDLHWEKFLEIDGPQHPRHSVFHSIVRRQGSVCLAFRHQSYTNKLEFSLYMLVKDEHNEKQQYSWSEETIPFPYSPRSSTITVGSDMEVLVWRIKKNIYFYNPQTDFAACTSPDPKA